MSRRFHLTALSAALASLSVQQTRRIITRGVIDMATSRILESEGYEYTGAVASADAADADKLKTAISAELAKHFDKVKDTHTEFEKQLKENGRVTEEMKKQIADLNTAGAKLITEQKAKEEKAAADILDLQQKLGELTSARRQGGAGEKSIGELYIESPEFKEFLPAGQRSGKHTARAFELKSFDIHRKNIISATGSGGAGIFPEYLPGAVIPNFMPLTIRDLLDNGTTESNSIIWVQEGVFTDNAGYQGSEGALKPQSDLTYTQQNIHVATIAHWFKASKQVLADFKILMTLINNRARFGLKLKEEHELLYGDGVGTHILGLIPQSTAYNQGYATGDTKLDTIRRAMLQTTLSYYPSTGIALSPYDWADIELTKDSYGRYMIGNPTGTAPKMLWGLPVAECFSMQRGDFLVGALRLAATVFDREQATLLLSTEDQDNFVRNMVTILAEERLALGVSRPAAIIYGAFKAGETG